MSEVIWAALIGGFFAVMGQWIIARKDSRELYAKLDKQSELSDAKLDAQIAVINAEISELTREVREHNNFARRVPVLEEKVAALERSSK